MENILNVRVIKLLILEKRSQAVEIANSNFTEGNKQIEESSCS